MPTLDDFLLEAKNAISDPQLPWKMNNLPKPIKRGVLALQPELVPAQMIRPHLADAADATSKVITGGLFAFLGAIRANPIAFTDTPADQAQAEETARRARLDTSDPMIRAFLAWDQQQGNPIGRALAANEGAASTPGGGNVLTGIANATFDPTNLIPMPAGKAGKAIEAGRKSERLGKLMEGVGEAGKKADLAELYDRFNTAAGGVRTRGKLGSIAQKEMVPGIGVGGKPGLGPRVPEGVNVQPIDDLVAAVRGNAKPNQGEQLANIMQGLLDRQAARGPVAASPLDLPVKGAKPGQARLPASIPADKLDQFVKATETVDGRLPAPDQPFWPNRGIDNADVPEMFSAARNAGIMGQTEDALLPKVAQLAAPRIDGTVKNTLIAIAYDTPNKTSAAAAATLRNATKKHGEDLLPRAAEIISLDPDKLAAAEKLIPGIGGQLDTLRTTVSESAPEDLFVAIRNAVKNLDVDRANKLVENARDYGVSPQRAQDILNAAASRGSGVSTNAFTNVNADTALADLPKIDPALLPEDLRRMGSASFGSGINFTLPGANAAIQVGKAALTSPVLGPAITGGVAGATTGGIAGGTAGFLANPEDRWGGLVDGARGGAVVGAAIGAGSFAYGLRHVDATTWENLAKHSWDLSRADVAASAKATKGGSILPSPKELISFWKNQTVSTVRQFGQDGTWNRLVLDGLQGKTATKLLQDTTRQISERMALKGNDRLSLPLQGILTRFGMKDRELELGMPLVEAVAQHGLSRAKSITSSLLLSSFSPSNVAGVAAAGIKGAAMPEFSGVIRHANGALNRGFREAAFVDEIDKKLIPLAVDEFKKLGYDLSSIPVDQLTADAVKQLHGARAGGMWQKALDNMIPLAESRVRYLFGDYSHGQKGAIGLIEKITGPGMPFSSWAIRAYPVALDMAVQNPWVALGVYQFLRATSAQAGKDGRPRWAAGKIPISTETPLLGAGARTLLGGQDGTAYIDPVGSLSPVGGDMFQPGNENEGPQSLYQQVSEAIGRVGLPGLSPIIQGIAYMLGLDYKGPGNLSRTQGSENALGLLPGNIDLPGWGDVALRAARGKVSPAFAGTELGARLGAQGDAHPTVYDPVARRYGELVVEATGHSLDDPGNRAYLYDLAAGTGELYDQARREVLLGGAARNVSSMTSPIGVATQGEGARRAKAEREGIPVKYADIAALREAGTKQQVAALNALNDDYKRAHPWAAAYDVGSKDEGRSMLMDDALRRYTFRGRQYSPSSPAELQRVVEAGRQRAEGNRIPPKK